MVCERHTLGWHPHKPQFPTADCSREDTPNPVKRSALCWSFAPANPCYASSCCSGSLLIVGTASITWPSMQCSPNTGMKRKESLSVSLSRLAHPSLRSS
jgi:hypothetical protein